MTQYFLFYISRKCAAKAEENAENPYGVTNKTFEREEDEQTGFWVGDCQYESLTEDLTDLKTPYSNSSFKTTALEVGSFV